MANTGFLGLIARDYSLSRLFTDSTASPIDTYIEMKIAEIKECRPEYQFTKPIKSYKPIGWHKILRTLQKNQTTQILKSHHHHKTPIKNKSRFFHHYNI